MAQLRALIIEDSSDLAFMIQVVLEQLSYEVVAVETVREARQVLQDSSGGAFSFVLLDLTLPDASAEDLIDEIRGSPITNSAKLVLSSGRADTAIVAKKHRVADALIKPFEIDDLIKIATPAP